MDRCKQVLMKQYGMDDIHQDALDLVPKRLARARNWVNMFGSDRDKLNVSETVPSEIISTFTDDDLKFLKELFS